MVKTLPSPLTLKAPVRVDLAGGTLDIHPLYLFLPGGGVTVNMAIPHYAQVTLTPRRDKVIELLLPDLKETPTHTFEHLTALDFAGPSGLVQRAIAYFAPRFGLSVKGEITLPVGTGLGASSTLLMALMHGLNHLTGAGLTPEAVIHAGADLEAQHILIPTGKQDYFPATFGGAMALHFSEHGVRREALRLSPAFARALGAAGVLVHTGHSRFSGANNWNMLKRVVEKKDHAPEKLLAIAQAATAARLALLTGDLRALARAVEDEWEVRRTLAKGVSNDRIEFLHITARKAGAIGGKILGAGGGGCYFCLAPPEKADRVRAALVAEGALSLAFGLEPRGALKSIE